MSEYEEDVVRNIQKVPSLKNADRVVFSNLIIQVVLFICLMCCFIFLRKRVKWLYSPNILRRPSHPCFSYDGYLNWILPIFTVSDSKLLTLIGLDAFMMLQTLKYIYRVFAFLSFIIFPVLGYIYWNEPHAPNMTNEYIIRLSLGNLNPMSKYYGIIPILLYVISIFIYYSMFVYYKRYTVLRQLFLRDPSTMTAITTLHKLYKQLHSAEKATEYLSLSNRTILVSNLPNFIKTDLDLKSFFESIKVGIIEDSILLHDTTKLRSLNTTKNEIIESIEKEINNAISKMNIWSIKNKEICAESFNEFSEELLKTVDKFKDDPDLLPGDKIFCFKKYIKLDENYKTYLKNNIKILDFYFDKLRIVFEDIKIEREKFEAISQINEKNTIIDINASENALFISGDVNKDSSFFGIYHLFNFRKYSMYFSLDIPWKTKKGFVVFKNYKDASIVKQAKLGSKVFSIEAENAPTPNDIIWENINKCGMVVFMFKTCGNLFFFVFNTFFIFIVVNTVEMVDLKNFDQNGRIVQFMLNHSTIRTIYQGNVPAMMYNLLLMFVPMIITTLVNLEGIESYSKMQHISMSKYANFLFFNGFISVFFAKTFYTNLKELVTQETSFHNFISELGGKILSSVLFFINTTIQKLFFGTALILLKPAPLLVNYIFVNIFPRKTRRQEEQSQFIPSIDFGNEFPNVLVVFPMILTYSVICPLILLPGLFYFIFIYLVYKNEFLYASRNQYESGGKYWEQATKLVINSLMTLQVATATMMFTHDRRVLSLSVLPLLYFTWIYRHSIETIFSKSCNCYPLNIQEENYLDEFTNKLNIDRIQLLNEWEEYFEGNKEDLVDLQDLGYVDGIKKSSGSYYKDPAMSTSISCFMLPRLFYRTLKFLQKRDKSNLFGYKNVNF